VSGKVEKFRIKFPQIGKT